MFADRILARGCRGNSIRIGSNDDSLNERCWFQSQLHLLAGPRAVELQFHCAKTCGLDCQHSHGRVAHQDKLAPVTRSGTQDVAATRFKLNRCLRDRRAI